LVPDEIGLGARRLIGCDVAAYRDKGGIQYQPCRQQMAIVDDMFSLPKENQQRRTIE
jgi:hypothetical protein